MFKSYGKIEYPNDWIIIKVNEDISSYYRSLLTSYYPSLKINRPKFGAHVSVLYGENEKINLEYKHFWNKYNNEIIEFKYNPHITEDREYFWIQVECEKIENIREELGLTRKLITPWHITIANIK